MKKTEEQLEEIIEQLDRIEAFLKEHVQSICNHDWIAYEGTSDFPMFICRKCGAGRSDSPNFATA